MEQGKDIITIDKSGNYCAYQLKTGNIDLPKWREIRPEIEELIQLPIIHPSIVKGKVKLPSLGESNFTHPFVG